MKTFEELKAFWASGEGKPYKGELIDIGAYRTNPSLSCMCAQGQILHALGGMTPSELEDLPVMDADEAVRKLMRISNLHAVLLRNVNDAREGAPIAVFDDLESLLGPNWSKVLDFWWHYLPRGGERVNDELFRKIVGPFEPQNAFCQQKAWALQDRMAAHDDAILKLTENTPWRAPWATFEIVLGEENPYFLPMYGFKTLAEIPARPDYYGTPDPELVK
jgi:hypothetical protein